MPQNPNPRLGELVPGYNGTIIAHLGAFPGRQLITWRAGDREPRAHSLPPVTQIAADAAGELIAALGPSSSDEFHSVLYLGAPSDLRPAAVDVKSFAWHGTDSGRLAWVTASVTADHVELWTGEALRSGLASSTLITEVPPATLLGWTPGGFFLASDESSTTSSSVLYLDLNGQEVWRREGHPSSLSVGHNSYAIRIYSVEADRHDFFQGSVLGHDEPRLLPTLEDAVWGPIAPNDGRIAAIGSTHLEIRAADGASLALWPREYGLGHLHWTPDGRFLVGAGAPLAEERWVAVFYDTIDGGVFEVSLPSWVLTFAAR